MSTRALRAAVEVAEEHGLRFSRPVVLRDRSNLLVRFEPLSVVARVPRLTATVRHGDAWLAREIAVAGHLACAGAPVVAPSSELPPGPHTHAGVTLTFFEYAQEVDAPLDAEEAGRRLRMCHEALAGFDGELPAMALMREADDILEQLASSGSVSPNDADALRREGEEARRRLDALSLPMQAVHGDAHLGNVINTAAGPLWNDWEDTMLAPRAWDLGCLHAAALTFGRDPGPVAAAQAGYGEGVEDQALNAFVAARAYQASVWKLVL